MQNHGRPSTQPNRITRYLAAHHRAAPKPTARRCAGSVVCVTAMYRLGWRWPNVGTIVPTLGQRWSNLHCCLGKLHITEPTHHRAIGLCAARWCAARLCVGLIRLGYVEGYPWEWRVGLANQLIGSCGDRVWNASDIYSEFSDISSYPAISEIQLQIKKNIFFIFLFFWYQLSKILISWIRTVDINYNNRMNDISWNRINDAI